MGSNKIRILFVSHKANKSGAPVLLLEIVKHLKQHYKKQIAVLCMEDGELVNSFKSICTTFVWPQSKNSKQEKAFSGISYFFNRIFKMFKAGSILWQLKDAELVFYNTIVNGHIQKKLSFTKSVNICYVHELEAAIQMLTNEQTRKTAFENTHLFLCVSDAVKQNLINSHNLPIQKTMLVSSPISISIQHKQAQTNYIQHFKKCYPTNNAIIIGVMGGNEWRKGYDLFFPLITLYFRLYPDSDVFFVWKGIKIDSHSAFFDAFDYNNALYKNRILLLPHSNEANAIMSCFDIHLLLSREDPYPLVVLEAASFAIPTVCFANSGGSPEFVENDAGIIVPYQDLLTMANKLHLLVQDPSLRMNLGNTAQLKVKQRHNKEWSLNNIQQIIFNNLRDSKYRQ